MALVELSRAWRLHPQEQASGVSVAKQLVEFFETELDVVELSVDLVEELSLLVEHVARTIFEERVLHDVYQNLFSCIISELSKSQCTSSMLYSSLINKINGYINAIELSSPLDFRRIEILLYASVTALKSIPTAEACVNDLITTIILTLIRLQEESLSIGKASAAGTLDRYDAESSKEITACCASLRKKSINSLRVVFIAHPQWINMNTETYWKVCISKLKTPLLFVGGYMTNNRSIVDSIITYIKTGLNNMLQYSVSTAKEIVRSIQELADYNCIELVDEDLLGLLLQNGYFNYSEALIAKQKSSCIVGWKVSIVTILTSLLTLCASTDGQPKIMFASKELTTSLIDLLVQDLFFLYFFLGYATDTTKLTGVIPASGGINKKQSARMSKLRFGTADEDNLMNLAHAIANLLVIYCENCLSDAMHAVVDTQGLLQSLISVLLNNIQRDVVFEDDQAHLCCEIDLLTRLTQLVARSTREGEVKYIFLKLKSLIESHKKLSTADDCVKDIYGDNVVGLLNRIVLLLKDQQNGDTLDMHEKDTIMRYSDDEINSLLDIYEKIIVVI